MDRLSLDPASTENSHLPEAVNDAARNGEQETDSAERSALLVPGAPDANLPRSPVHRIDGAQMKELFRAAAHWLERHAAAINALNVFPVPDGDTGTNMLMTMRSAMKEIAEYTSHNATDIAERFARGALMGARGNSGVILSQILRGFARAGQDKEFYTASDVAHAFRQASESAYRAVMKPVEGTILTVSRAMAEGAEEAAAETKDIQEQLRRATQAARTALLRTPEMLPILKEAGVVDSGGQGLVTILEGMLRQIRGEAEGEESAPDTAPAPVGFGPEMQVHLDAPPPTLDGERYGYDIQYLIRGDGLDVSAIRVHINGLGDCPLVVGDETLVKIHVHALSPGPALDYGAGLGMLDDVVVENLDLQFADFFAQQEKAAEGKDLSATGELTTESVTGVGIVAVAAGDGLAQALRNLGVSAVVTGGQSMNPSTEDLLTAIAGVRADGVILLPNNKNILMAAQQAAELADRPVFVVPSRSTPQGLAALMAFDYSKDARANAEVMAEALHQVVTVELTSAVRTTNINGIDVRTGDVIGLLDGQLAAAGPDDLSVACRLLDRIDLDAYEFAAIYYGEDREEAQAEELRVALEERYPEMAFECQPGGQPHYSYIFSIE
ncbi:MAG: DAK2 domain-containing protein [Chloroflexi bacterium]|nr:DAK2 domain-containing protein [Chloroflexota bacterium]